MNITETRIYNRNQHLYSVTFAMVWDSIQITCHMQTQENVTQSQVKTQKPELTYKITTYLSQDVRIFKVATATVFHTLNKNIH